jgi:hypothetical protein
MRTFLLPGNGIESNERSHSNYSKIIMSFVLAVVHLGVLLQQNEALCPDKMHGPSSNFYQLE